MPLVAAVLFEEVEPNATIVKLRISYQLPGGRPAGLLGRCDAAALGCVRCWGASSLLQLVREG